MVDLSGILSLQDRRELRGILHRSGHTAQEHGRANAILLLDDGVQLWFLLPYSPNLNLIERVWKFFRKKVMNNRYYASFKEFTEETLMFFECLSEYADELRTLLTHNFRLFGHDTENQVTNAY